MTSPRPHSQEWAELQFALFLPAFGVSNLLPALSCFPLLPHLRDVSVLCDREAPCWGPKNHSFVQTWLQQEGNAPIPDACRGPALLGAGEAKRKGTVEVPGLAGRQICQDETMNPASWSRGGELGLCCVLPSSEIHPWASHPSNNGYF